MKYLWKGDVIMSIKVLIADDEPLARNQLIYLLKKIEGVEIVGEASTGEDTLRMIKEIRPDTVFLDIQMPKINGIEVAHKMLDWENPPFIVFATAYDEHAVKAFELNAIDYVLKPFEEDRVIMTIKRIKSRSCPNTSYFSELSVFLNKVMHEFPSAFAQKQNKLIVEKDDCLIVLNPEEIVYISREGRDVVVKTTTKKIFLSNNSLHFFESKLRLNGFLRTHRAFLVNLEYIHQVIPWFNGAYTLILKDDDKSKIPVSRSYIKSLKEVLGIV